MSIWDKTKYNISLPDLVQSVFDWPENVSALHEIGQSPLIDFVQPYITSAQEIYEDAADTFRRLKRTQSFVAKTKSEYMTALKSNFAAHGCQSETTDNMVAIGKAVFSDWERGVLSSASRNESFASRPIHWPVVENIAAGLSAACVVMNAEDYSAPRFGFTANAEKSVDALYGLDTKSLPPKIVWDIISKELWKDILFFNDAGYLKEVTSVVTDFNRNATVPTKGELQPIDFSDCGFTDGNITAVAHSSEGPLPTKLDKTGFPKYIYKAVNPKETKVLWDPYAGQLYYKLPEDQPLPAKLDFILYPTLTCNFRKEMTPSFPPNPKVNEEYSSLKNFLAGSTREIFEEAIQYGDGKKYGAYALTKLEQLKWIAYKLSKSWDRYEETPQGIQQVIDAEKGGLSLLHTVVKTANCALSNAELFLAASAYGFKVRLTSGKPASEIERTGSIVKIGLSTPGHATVEAYEDDEWFYIDATPWEWDNLPKDLKIITGKVAVMKDYRPEVETSVRLAALYERVSQTSGAEKLGHILEISNLIDGPKLDDGEYTYDDQLVYENWIFEISGPGFHSYPGSGKAYDRWENRLISVNVYSRLPGDRRGSKLGSFKFFGPSWSLWKIMRDRPNFQRNLDALRQYLGRPFSVNRLYSWNIPSLSDETEGSGNINDVDEVDVSAALKGDNISFVERDGKYLLKVEGYPMESLLDIIRHYNAGGPLVDGNDKPLTIEELCRLKFRKLKDRYVGGSDRWAFYYFDPDRRIFFDTFYGLPSVINRANGSRLQLNVGPGNRLVATLIRKPDRGGRLDVEGPISDVTSVDQYLEMVFSNITSGEFNDNEKGQIVRKVYELIRTNPPYFISTNRGGSSTLDMKRTAAFGFILRKAEELGLDEEPPKNGCHRVYKDNIPLDNDCRTFDDPYGLTHPDLKESLMDYLKYSPILKAYKSAMPYLSPAVRAEMNLLMKQIKSE